MDLIERFRYIMKLNGLSASAFADEIGVQRSSVSHILSGRNKPSLEFIQKVMNKFPKVDASWLINGSTKPKTEEMDLPDKKVESKVENIVVKGNTVPQEPTKGANKEIDKVLIFYTDGTFAEFKQA